MGMYSCVKFVNSEMNSHPLNQLLTNLMLLRSVSPWDYLMYINYKQKFELLIRNIGPRLFSDIYGNGENSCPVNQKCKKLVEFALNCGY